MSSDEGQALKCDKILLDEIISRATEHSLYAVNHQLKQGFLTLNDEGKTGVRSELNRA